MKKYSILLLLIMCLSIMSALTWIRSYSIEGVCPYPYSSSNVQAYNVIPAIGGGYLLQGFVEFSDYEFFVFAANVFWKVDESGDIVWRRHSGQQMQAYDIIASNGLDRYYCISSYAHVTRMDVFDNQLNYINTYDFWDINGFPASLYDAVITDDGLVFAGRIGSGAVVLKTDFEFNIVWTGDTVSQASSDGFYQIINTNNNGYLALGHHVLAKYSAVGDTLWTAEVNHMEYGYYCMAASTLGTCYVLTASHLTDEWLIKSFGNFGVCENTIPVDLDRIVWEGSRNMSVLEDGNLIVFIPSIQKLNKVTLSGAVLWSRSFPIATTGYGPKNFIVASDSSFVFCSNQEVTVTLVKTDSNGIVVSNEDPILTPSAISSSHYPNPARDQITIDYKAESRESILTLEVFNIRGQMLYSCPLTGSEGSHQLSLLQDTDSRWAPGVYMYLIKDEHLGTSISKRFIITKQGRR